MMTLSFDEPVLTAEQERELADLMQRGKQAQSELRARAARTVTDASEARRALHLVQASPTLPRAAAVTAEASASDLEHTVAVGREARARFARANLRLVAQVSNGLARRARLDADELFQEGVVGLMEAIDRFDVAYQARFATFALPRIRMRVREAALTRCGELGLPVRRAKQWVRVVSAYDALAVAQGRTPLVAEVARAVGLPVSEVEQLSAFQPPLGGDAVTDIAWISGDDQSSDEIDWQVRRLLHRLSRDERAVMMRRYGLGPFNEMSYAEIATELDVSPSTVRRRERSALGRLRAAEDVLAAA